jgi:hypothetical protein
MSTYSNRLYDHFQRERTAFGRWVLAIVSAGIFFILVFQPYLGTLAELFDLDSKLAQQISQIKTAQTDIKAATGGISRASEYMGDASAYQALYDDADSWVNSLDDIHLKYDRQSRRLEVLRNALDAGDQAVWQRGKVPPDRIIKKLKQHHPEIMDSYRRDQDCFFRLDEDWLRCLVGEKLRPVHKRLARVLYDRTDSHDYTSRLNQRIRANQKKYHDGLAAAIGRAEIADWVRTYIEEEKAIIRSWYEWLAEERSRLIRDDKQRQSLVAQNEEQIGKLEKRKNEISESGRLNTAVGPLPLAFFDLLPLLPLILLISGNMMLLSLARLAELRQKFELSAPDDETVGDALRLTMPIWLDPLRGNSIGLPVLALLLVPAIAALFGIGQLMTSPGLKISPFLQNLTIAGSLIATILYAVQYVNLCRVWRQALRRE